MKCFEGKCKIHLKKEKTEFLQFILLIKKKIVYETQIFFNLLEYLANYLFLTFIC